MMKDKIDGSSKLQVLGKQYFRGRLIVGNTKAFTKDNYQ
jgi:hypothetical protein